MTTYIGIDATRTGALVATDHHGAVLLAERVPLFRGVFDVREAHRLFDQIPRPFIGAADKRAVNCRGWQAASGVTLVKCRGVLPADPIAWCHEHALSLDLRPGRCKVDHLGLATARCIAEWLRVWAQGLAAVKRRKPR